MKSILDISPALKAHLIGPVLTIAWCWILRRKDGLVVASTTHVEPLSILSKIAGVGTVTCKPTASFVTTDIARTDSLSQDNLDVTCVLDDDAVTETDLRAGRWRNAQLEICIVNYRDLSMGTDTLFMGTLGNLTAGALQWKSEQRGLTQPLEANLDGIVSDQCDCRVGDARCGVDLGPYTRTGTVSAPVADRQFVDAARTEPDQWWREGVITMTSGASKGDQMEVKRSLADGTIELVEEFFYGIAGGDTYSMTPGCNRLLLMPDGTYTGDCKVKFDNVIRFRGFPRVPGQAKISQYGGQGVS